MSEWLEDFAYKVNISWWIFIVAGVMALFIAFITVRFPGDKSSDCKPGKKFENGMKPQP